MAFKQTTGHFSKICSKKIDWNILLKQIPKGIYKHLRISGGCFFLLAPFPGKAILGRAVFLMASALKSAAAGLEPSLFILSILCGEDTAIELLW
jgi:hypothetical protein